MPVYIVIWRPYFRVRWLCEDATYISWHDAKNAMQKCIDRRGLAEGNCRVVRVDGYVEHVPATERIVPFEQGE